MERQISIVFAVAGTADVGLRWSYTNQLKVIPTSAKVAICARCQ